jgi:putative addiction module killer protein
MNTFERTEEFDFWLETLNDQIITKILARIDAASLGNFGDCAPVGQGISEMRIHTGPGYRIYYSRIGFTIYLLLAGGNKSTQQKDIQRAIKLARGLKKGEH